MTTQTNNTIKANTTLTARSIGDYNCIFSLPVLKRTAKMATVIYMGNEQRVKIKIDSDGNEYIKPANYSMAPIFRA